MDIFNSNSRLRELTMYAIDWGIFLRHESDSANAPFLLLKNGKDTLFRMLMTDGNPIEFATRILPGEKTPFEQFVIGYEGYLRDDNNNRVDSIIIQGYDVTQDKGVILGQMFNPKENGGFRKINKLMFLGHTDLIIEKKNNPDADYSVEEFAITGFSAKDKEGLKYVAAFVHHNPSVIANEIKHYVRSKFADDIRLQASGSFDLHILDEKIDVAFLKFLVTNAINEEIETANVIRWQSETGRTLNIKIKHGSNGDNIIYEV